MKQKSITFSKDFQKVLDKSNGRAVLLSIKKQWLDKILSKEKTIEVRKTFPWDVEYPFVVLCYETKSDGGAGKITAAFICSCVDKLDCLTTLPTLSNEKAITYLTKDFIKQSCLSKRELYDYGKNSGALYGWNISDIIELDIPISEFKIKRPPQSWMYITIDSTAEF